MSLIGLRPSLISIAVPLAPSGMTPDLAKGTSIEAGRAAATELAWAAPHHAPPPSGSKDRAGLRFPLAHLSVSPSGAPLGATQSLQPPWGRATGWRPTPLPPWRSAKLPAAKSAAWSCTIYPDGIKAYGHERITQPIGRRGKPIKKLRYMPMARAHALALASKLQGRFGTTVSVI